LIVAAVTFGVLGVACVLFGAGFAANNNVGVIGGADGPTSIFVSQGAVEELIEAGALLIAAALALLLCRHFKHYSNRK